MVWMDPKNDVKVQLPDSGALTCCAYWMILFFYLCVCICVFLYLCIIWWWYLLCIIWWWYQADTTRCHIYSWGHMLILEPCWLVHFTVWWRPLQFKCHSTWAPPCYCGVATRKALTRNVQYLGRQVQVWQSQNPFPPNTLLWCERHNTQITLSFPFLYTTGVHSFASKI